MFLARFAFVTLLVLTTASAASPGPGPATPDQGEALRDAALAGDVARVRALLDLGVPLEAEARHGQTALYFAADKGHLEVVRLLVERGANVNVRDRFFKGSALRLALGNGHLDVARYLLAHGATDADEALQAAVARGDVELARAALGSGRIEPLEPLELLAARAHGVSYPRPRRGPRRRGQGREPAGRPKLMESTTPA